MVRAAATVAGSEAEFVRLLRDAGLAARPRYDRVGGHRVVGYAVAEEPSDGGVAVFFGGGKLARDLSLPALRDRWRDGEAESQEAAAEWAGGAPATGVHEAPRAGRHLTYRWAEASAGVGASRRSGKSTGCQPSASPARWREATEGLGEVVRELGAVPAEDVTTWRAVASDAAGALAVLSGRLERVPGPLAHASGLLARSAQGPRQRPAKARCVPRGTIKSVAALMAQADLDEDTPAAWRLLLAEMLRVAQAVHDAHLARSESQQAGRLADEARKALDNVEGAPRVAGSAPGRAPRGSRACPRGSRARTGGGCEASAPTGWAKVRCGQSSSPGRQRGGHRRNGPRKWGGERGRRVLGRRTAAPRWPLVEAAAMRDVCMTRWNDVPRRVSRALRRRPSVERSRPPRFVAPSLYGAIDDSRPVHRGSLRTGWDSRGRLEQVDGHPEDPLGFGPAPEAGGTFAPQNDSR